MAGECVQSGGRGVYARSPHGLSPSASSPWLPPRRSRLLPESDIILLPSIAKHPGEAEALGVARAGDLEGVQLAQGGLLTSWPPGVRFGSSCGGSGDAAGVQASTGDGGDQLATAGPPAPCGLSGRMGDTVPSASRMPGPRAACGWLLTLCAAGGGSSRLPALVAGPCPGRFCRISRSSSSVGAPSLPVASLTISGGMPPIRKAAVIAT